MPKENKNLSITTKDDGTGNVVLSVSRKKSEQERAKDKEDALEKRLSDIEARLTALEKKKTN